MKDTLWLHQHAAWLKLYLWYETINWGGDVYSPWMMVTLGSINFQQNSVTNPFPSQGSQSDICLSCALLEQLHPTWWLQQKQRAQLSCRVSSYHHLPSFPFEGTNRTNFLLPSSHQRKDWRLQDIYGSHKLLEEHRWGWTSLLFLQRNGNKLESVCLLRHPRWTVFVSFPSHIPNNSVQLLLKTYHIVLCIV